MTMENNPIEEVDVTVTLDGVTKKIKWPRTLSLLHALLKAEIAVPYDCSRAQCGTCVCKLEEGEIDMRRNFILTESHLNAGLILPCVSKTVSSQVTINFDAL